MHIKLTVHAGIRTTAALRIPSEIIPAEPTHVRVAYRGPLALGWNRLYATLVAQAQHDGRTGDAAASWVRQILSALSQIDGMHPDALSVDDLKNLLATPALGSVTLASGLAVDTTLSVLDARDQDLGDPYSPVDDPDPSFAETFFPPSASAVTSGYPGWWSPMERESLAIGAPGGPGRIEDFGPASNPASDPPQLTSLSDIGIDGTHRLVYFGQDRILDWVPAATASQYRAWSYDRTGGPSASLAAIVSDPQAWTTIDAGHELVWLGRDLQADPHSTDDLVLDWTPATGGYRLYRIDLAGTKTDVSMPDLLPEPPLTRGNWTSIRTGKKLVYLGGNRVLDWEPVTGNFRIWILDRSAAAASDPLPTLEAQGTWETIRDGHRIINLGGDRVLTWVPATGWYRVWRYDRSVKGTGDPLVSPPVIEGYWQDIGADHELIWLGGRQVLDWQPGSGAYHIRSFDRTVGSSNPLP